MAARSESFSVAPSPDPSTYVGRLEIEANQLEERLIKLQAFAGMPTFASLAPEEQIDLNNQGEVMKQYLTILRVRLKRAQQQ